MSHKLRFELTRSVRHWLLAAMLVVAFAATSAGDAASRPPPDSFADLVVDLRPAVVAIATSSARPAGKQPVAPFDELPPGAEPDEFFEFFEDDEQHGGRRFRPITSLGSGFIVDPTGYVVTNNHVIAGADEVTVVLDDGERLSAIVVGHDEKTDLALLKVTSDTPLPFVSFGNSDVARVGDWVIAIGNPFGLGNSVTAGILSARGRDINAGPYDDFLQTDAPINRGNSGGPMFDMDGNVIGVNTLIYSPSGGSVGIGFATPSNIARVVVNQLREFGRTVRGWLGVRIQSVTPEIANRNGLPGPTGALVASVIEDGPAATGDVRQGDVILRFGGREVPNRRALPRMVAETDVGAEVAVVLWRDGGEVSTAVTIGRLEDYEVASAHTPIEPQTHTFEHLGLTLADITDAQREVFGLADEQTGVVVTNVVAASGADAAPVADLAPGDIILKVDRQPVHSVADVLVVIATFESAGAPVILMLRQRGTDQDFVAIKLKDE